MTRTKRHPLWSWALHTPWVLAILGVLAVAIFFGSGSGNPVLRRLIAHRLETLTGCRVELRDLSIQWLSLKAVLKGVVIHGREPATTEPLFAAEEMQAGLRIDSFWGRKISLDQLFIEHPHVHVRVENNGSTNLPALPRRGPTNKSLPETLLDLRVRRLRLDDGWVLYNDVQKPLAVEGENLQLNLDGSGPLDRYIYLGQMEWKSVQFAGTGFLPVGANISAKFTLGRDGFILEQCVLTALRSHVDVQAEMNGFVQPKWSFRYRGWINLLDFRETLNQPLVPTGLVDVRGEGELAAGRFKSSGTYSGSDITLSYPVFHTSGVTSRASYRADNRGLEIPDFFAGTLGGNVKGRVTLNFSDMQFRAQTHVQDIRVAKLLPTIEHAGFPIDELRWDALLTADTIENWTGPFLHFNISVKMHWSAPEATAAGHQPVTGDWQFGWLADPNILTVQAAEFETPSSRGSISGTLKPRDSALNLKIETGALETYKDFINALQNAEPGSPQASKEISGNVRWDGKITGPSGKPTFSGHLRGERIKYDGLALDLLEGDLNYSPSRLELAHGRVVRSEMNAEVEMSMELTEWSFLPANTWSSEVNFEKTPIDNIQQILGWSYPVRGLLSGRFHGAGTRRDPGVTGLFDLREGNVYGLSFEALRGQLTAARELVRIANAELRFFPPEKENGRGAGIVTGTAEYHFGDQTVSAELVGAGLPLENFQKLQSPRLPVGGQASFRLKVNGPARAPQGDGTLRVVNLRVGQEIIGSFDGNVSSDGQTARLELMSAMTTGELAGNFTLGLRDPYPFSGKTTIKNIDLDPFLLAALHLEKFSGDGFADGEISLSGSLKRPDTFVADAKFSRLVLNYANVLLENSGPVNFRASRDSVAIEPATLHGKDTNMQIEGSVQFAGRRTVALRLNGALDLTLLTGVVPSLEARGPAQINATVEGTLDRPRVTGRVHIENASTRVGDFPSGLSAIKGDLIFDTTRVFFNEVTAESGGGTLHFSGSVNYTERPLRYDVNLRTDRMRIRYPEGMSWLASGTLRLTGSPDAGILSGRVIVERVALTQGLEIAGALVSAKQGISGPSTGSSFLRNLQFDIEAISAPDSRMEWPSAELQAEANLRVRGTWEHPILLGHIHILSGDLYFAGNRYRVARGDLNFANPFRLDPVLNVEATTTIQQYEITLNFNGPASKLTLAYRSDPPLPANDIVTLLALGKTTSEATTRSGGTTQSSTSGATALLSEAISSQLGGRVERLFGITRFRVDPGLGGVGSTGSSQNAGARVTVEQQITRKLTITYVSNVTSTQQQVIQVEYNVNRNVSIVALRDQNGTFGIDVKIKKRFP